MRNVIAVIVLGLFLAACEVSMPGVNYEGRYNPPSSWAMTPESEALIKEVRYETWKQMRDRAGRSLSKPCGYLLPDNTVVICDYLNERSTQEVYEHEVFHMELRAAGVSEEDNAGHSSEYWVLASSAWDR